MTLKIAVLTVGDELINGEMADTNTARIARILGRYGYFLRESVSIGDIETDIEEALLALAARRDVVIVTGGLGPTADDLTARSAARALKRRLIVHQEALEQIQGFFSRAGKQMHPRDERQALLPQKATILPNPVGVAPGFRLHHNGRDLFFLPGVPEEMGAMMEESVVPHLQERSGGSPARERIFTLFGLSEPQVEEILSGHPLPEGVEAAFGVDYPYVLLKLRSKGPSAETNLDRAEPPVHRLFDRNLAAFGGESPVEFVARLLTSAGLTLSLAESCTGGLLAAQLTEIPGASAFLERGAVTYANSAKEDWLGVPAKILETEGAVSEGCALAMARGIRRKAGTDIGVAVTGIAGPTGGTPQKPVGTVYFGLAAPGVERVQGYCFTGDRGRVRRMATCMALDWLRRHLLDRLTAGGNEL